MEPEKFWLHGYLFSAAELKSLVKLKKEKKVVHFLLLIIKNMSI